MGKKRKTHSPQFKAKFALAAIQKAETTSNLAKGHSSLDDYTPDEVYYGAPRPFSQAA